MAGAGQLFCHWLRTTIPSWAATHFPHRHYTPGLADWHITDRYCEGVSEGEAQRRHHDPHGVLPSARNTLRYCPEPRGDLICLPTLL